MNLRILLLFPFTFFLTSALRSQAPRTPEPPVPVMQAQPDTTDKTLLTPPAGEDQRVYGPRYTTLVSEEVARILSDKFRAAYGQASSPRMVIFVNRALAPGESGLRLTGRTERVYETTTDGQEKGPTRTTETSGENTYAANEAAKATLADQQTVREVERLFGRVFRNAGARLADPRAATALIGDQPDVRLGGDEAIRERDALKHVADIAIEVLISSRDLKVVGLSSDATYSVPDIQVTAIRLSDAAIVGQAAASDVLGHGAQAGQVVRQFGVADITEATAFALMEDMLTGSDAVVK
jgi:hypothetical protein